MQASGSGRWPLLGVVLLGAASLTAAAEPTPQLAVIIDDLGFRLAEDQAVFELDRRVAVAIIPNAPLARRMASLARQQQRTALVHLPLAQDPVGSCDAPVCPAREWSAERMQLHLAWAFGQVQGAAGVNNHQGSLFTADPIATQRLLDGLLRFSENQGLAPFVIDSRTIAGSQLEHLAGEAGFRTARRDIFLDHDRTEPAMARAWQQAIELAHQQGQAVVIAHPHPETTRFLHIVLPALPEAGVALVEIQALLRDPERAPGERPVVPGTSAADSSSGRSPMSPFGP